MKYLYSPLYKTIANSWIIVQMLQMMNLTMVMKTIHNDDTAATLSQKIATESIGTQVSFTHSMLNMLGDRLHNIPKNYQFRSPFDNKGRRPDVPLTKALALMRKIKNNTSLHMYFEHISNHLQHPNHAYRLL
jgi:hypothetical protein